MTVDQLLDLLVADYADQGQRLPAAQVKALREAFGGTRAHDLKRPIWMNSSSLARAR